jgi:dihydrofolate reductase
MIPLTLIVAVADNGVIGRDNQMPWRLSTDLKRFRALTMGKPVVMGRKTFQSIGKPLDGRTTIVVTRDPSFAAPGVVVAPSLTAALACARGDALRRGADAIMVAGGADIYAQALPLADALAVTFVHATPEGDRRFPAIDSEVWQEVERSEHAAGPKDSAPFAFAAYRRARSGQIASFHEAVNANHVAPAS